MPALIIEPTATATNAASVKAMVLLFLSVAAALSCGWKQTGGGPMATSLPEDENDEAVREGADHVALGALAGEKGDAGACTLTLGSWSKMRVQGQSRRSFPLFGHTRTEYRDVHADRQKHTRGAWTPTCKQPPG